LSSLLRENLKDLRQTSGATHGKVNPGKKSEYII
jgi:hypothetical protein